MDIEGLHALITNLREDFQNFRSNEFHAVEEKVDKLGIKVAWIVGTISGITIVVNVLLRILL